MKITHEEARKLIHFKADNALKPVEQNALLTHLDNCAECQTYANSIQGMEFLLRPILQRKWSQRPTPLSVRAILAKKEHRISQMLFLATRIAVVGIICIGFAVSIWQFTLSGQPTAVPPLPSVPPIPTPSTQFMNTSTVFNQCEGRSYIVQADDTLENIAERFLVSEQDILMLNNLRAGPIQRGWEILIPVCTSTPTGTVNALTTTHTPFQNSLTSTPGG